MLRPVWSIAHGLFKFDRQCAKHGSFNAGLSAGIGNRVMTQLHYICFFAQFYFNNYLYFLLTFDIFYAMKLT